MIKVDETEHELSADEILAAVPGMLEIQKWQNEPLDLELEFWVEESETFGRMLRHPLVYQVPLLLPGQANEALRQKKKALETAIEAQDWESVLWIHERPHRTNALVEYIVGTDDAGDPIRLEDLDQSQRDAALSIWTDSENLQQHVDEWNLMLETSGPDVFLGGDRDAFNELPDPVTVYRGDIEDGGWSWTTDQKVAEWFARRFRDGDDEAPVLRGQVEKRWVIAYLTNRQESEILAPFERVTNVERIN